MLEAIKGILPEIIAGEEVFAFWVPVANPSFNYDNHFIRNFGQAIRV